MYACVYTVVHISIYMYMYIMCVYVCIYIGLYTPTCKQVYLGFVKGWFWALGFGAF